MSRLLVIFAVLCVGLGGAVWASRVGMGVPVPEKEPPSIREGSTTGRAARGHHRTRYFVGGGYLSGK